MPLSPIDSAAGQAFHRERKRVGLFQKQVGAAIGVSGQQIQKYENGKNRIPISKLARICHKTGMSFGAIMQATLDAAIEIHLTEVAKHGGNNESV